MEKKASYLMTPRQRESLLAELREQDYESTGYDSTYTLRPRLVYSGIEAKDFESFGVR